MNDVGMTLAPTRSVWARSTAWARSAGLARSSLLALASVLVAACSQTPIAPGANTGASSAAGSRGSRVASPSEPMGIAPRPNDGAVPLLAKLDGMIVEWDEAQASGQVDQAALLEQQIRYEVDANQTALEQGVRGEKGLAAQYLAVSALGFSSNPAHTRMIVKLLGTKDPQLVANALIALKLRADPETPLGPIMAWIEKSSATGPRRYAPLALAVVLEARARVGRPSEGGTSATAVGRLSLLIDDVDPVVRLHVARALGVIRTPTTVDPLRTLVADGHARVSWAAAAALSGTGDLRGFLSVLRLLDATPAESKHLIRDILVSYATAIEKRPLTEGQLAQLGTGTRAWSQWYTHAKRQRGIAPGSAQDAALDG